MEPFKCDSIEDLIFNRSFRHWVLYKQKEDSEYWENFVRNNPEKQKLINDSKAIIYALQINFKGFTEDEINAEIRKILNKSKSQSATVDERLKSATLFQFLFRHKTAVAASLSFFIIATVFLYTKSIKTHIASPGNSGIAQTENIFDYKNVSDTIQLLSLPDGSKISLSPKSLLSYKNDFNSVDRRVFLSGEAFFEVSKNASKPFFVFTNTLVTKVLGTSFNIKAYPSDKRSIVVVRTGKVSVIKVSQFSETYSKGTELGGMLITPNQQAVYIPENNDLNKGVTEKPVLTSEAAKLTFKFDATPVKKVFQTMQDAYSIPILFDEEVLSSCSLSATMGDEPFYDKLNIICKAINASYEMIDGNIVVTSNGCK